MRVLLLEDNSIDALAIQRELAGRFELRTVATLAEATTLLAHSRWQPDLIVTDLSLPDSEGLITLRNLQAAAKGVPIIVSTGLATDVLGRQVDALLLEGAERHAALGALRCMIAHHHRPGTPAPLYRPDIAADVERLSRQAAEAAVTRTIDELIARLGLDDEEGLRMAARLARGWEAAKIRFVSALTTGLASAFLLALGAGLVAMLRQSSPR